MLLVQREDEREPNKMLWAMTASLKKMDIFPRKFCVADNVHLFREAVSGGCKKKKKKKERPYISLSFTAAFFPCQVLKYGCYLRFCYLLSFFLIWSLLYHFSSVAGYNYHCYNYLMPAAMTHFFTDITINTSSFSLDFSKKYLKFNMTGMKLIIYLPTRPSICFCPSSVKRITIWPFIQAKCICLP